MKVYRVLVGGFRSGGNPFPLGGLIDLDAEVAQPHVDSGALQEWIEPATPPEALVDPDAPAPHHEAKHEKPKKKSVFRR